jgi:phosphatidylglycerol:prolipoprotein diacylglycerol transferase
LHYKLFSLGPFTLYSYGALISIGFLLGMLMAVRRARKRGLNPDYAFNLALLVLIAGFAGAKILYFIVEYKSIAGDPLSILDLRSGFVVYGGIIGGYIAAYAYCRRKGVRFFQYADLLLPSVALAQGFGRLGCLMAGCCYGLETSGPLGIKFPHGALAPSGVALYPTQIMSSAGDFAICLALLLLARKRRPEGLVSALYLLLYGAGRFAVEFFRGDPRGSVYFLSVSQFISIFIVIGGIAVFIRSLSLQSA